MDRFITVDCSREQAGVLTRNCWRLAQLRTTWVCVREPNVWVSIIPGPIVHCHATIETLDTRPDGLELADDDCVDTPKPTIPRENRHAMNMNVLLRRFCSC